MNAPAPSETSFIARLLAAADASLRAEPADFVLPSFPWLPRPRPVDANLQCRDAGVTAQAEVSCT